MTDATDTPRTPMDAEKLRKGWEHLFSTENPFNPVTLKAFEKIVRWAEREVESTRCSPVVGEDGFAVVGYRRKVSILNGYSYEVCWHWSTKAGDGWEPIYGHLSDGEQSADKGAKPPPPEDAIPTQLFNVASEEAEWARRWHGCAEAICIILGVPHVGSPDELVAAVREKLSADSSAAPAPREQKSDELRLEWRDGEPPRTHRDEWFIAETIYGDRVVLKALPEEFTYDYTTADGTYMAAKNVKRWMQFPDSDYIAPVATSPPSGGVQPSDDDAAHVVTILAEGIATAAKKAGIYNGEVSLSGPHLLQLLDDLASAAQPSGGDTAQEAGELARKLDTASNRILTGNASLGDAAACTEAAEMLRTRPMSGKGGA